MTNRVSEPVSDNPNNRPPNSPDALNSSLPMHTDTGVNGASADANSSTDRGAADWTASEATPDRQGDRPPFLPTEAAPSANESTRSGASQGNAMHDGMYDGMHIDAKAVPTDSDRNGEGDRNEIAAVAGAAAGKAAQSFWVELRNILALSILLALGIRHFIAEARYIPSESMLPTLEVNDRLIVEKVTYRFKEPERGDIVVFRPTDSIREENPTFNDALIKRIVGLPGDTVEVQGGQVFINGEPIVEDYINEAPTYTWGPQVVSADSYLVLGDNRNNSYDSHYWGFVPRENLIGRAAVRVWPLGRIGSLDDEPVFLYEVEEGAEQSITPSP